MRPLFFDFADDPQAAAVEDQFLFGPDLLVAPVTKFALRQRPVYLPAGTTWTDAWTGKEISGGQVIQADAPLEHIPVFIRGSQPQLVELFRTLEIFSFKFGPLGPATVDGTEITIRVPRGTDLTSLAPTYTASPGTVGRPASGSLVDFTRPQAETASAGAGEKK
jgi:hypothetical protein